MSPGRGLIALGDSITRGRGGSPLRRVHPQSWALWLAEALEMPYTNLAADAARAEDVARVQLPRVGEGYDVACLHVGANDARALQFAAADFERDVMTVVELLAQRAQRLLVLTVPLDLGRPRAGQDVAVANAILRRAAGSEEAVVCELEDLRGWRLMLPDAVHPTAPGQVEIARRAAAALAGAGLVAPRAPELLADEDTSRLALARYAGWYGRQMLRDARRRAWERWVVR